MGTTPVETPRAEEIVEQIDAKNSTDHVEAIQDILTEITDMR